MAPDLGTLAPPGGRSHREARLDGVVGRIQRALWTANIDQLTASRENRLRLADALDALLVVLKDKPAHIGPLIDDQRGS